MEANYWWVWIVLAAVFIVGEIFTAGFFLLWFGVGAAVAGGAAFLGLGIAGQLAVFVVVSLALFFVSRPFAERFSKEQPAGVGADRFVGKSGIVLQTIDAMANTGRVRVDSEVWRATGVGDETIAEGAHIVVTGISGNHLVVKAREGE